MTTDLRAQFTDRITHAYQDNQGKSPAAACRDIYWVSRLYPTMTTQDVTAILAPLDHRFARLYIHWRFNDITSRA